MVHRIVPYYLAIPIVCVIHMDTTRSHRKMSRRFKNIIVLRISPFVMSGLWVIESDHVWLTLILVEISKVYSIYVRSNHYAQPSVGNENGEDEHDN